MIYRSDYPHDPASPTRTPMLPRSLRFALFSALVGAVPAASPARQDAPKATPKPSEAGEKLATTDHTLTVNGNRIDYRSTAGTLTLHDDEGKATARVFFVAY